MEERERKQVEIQKARLAARARLCEEANRQYEGKWLLCKERKRQLEVRARRAPSWHSAACPRHAHALRGVFARVP